jgi:hypothetical protein
VLNPPDAADGSAGHHRGGSAGYAAPAPVQLLFPPKINGSLEEAQVRARREALASFVNSLLAHKRLGFIARQRLEHFLGVLASARSERGELQASARPAAPPAGVGF